jgi:hypothetical protein
MIMFVLDDIQFEHEILNSWSEIGITGATIIESSGLHRHLKKVIPMRYAFYSGQSEETGNLTFFVMVETEKMVKACLETIEKIVGDLNEPNTGIFSAWPLSIIKGIPPLEQKER